MLAHCNKETHFKLEFVDGSIILTRESFEIGIIRCQECIYIIRSSVCVSVSHLLQNHWLHKVENGTVLITKDPGSAGSKSFNSVINIFIILIDKCSDKANVNYTSGPHFLEDQDTEEGLSVNVEHEADMLNTFFWSHVRDVLGASFQ